MNNQTWRGGVHPIEEPGITLIALTSDLKPRVAHSPVKQSVAKKAQRPIANMQSVSALIENACS